MFDLLVLHNRVPQIAAPSNNHFVVTRNWKMQEDGFCPVIPEVSAGDAQARGGGGGERGGQLLTFTLTVVNAAVCRGLGAPLTRTPQADSPYGLSFLTAWQHPQRQILEPMLQGSRGKGGYWKRGGFAPPYLMPLES